MPTSTQDSVHTLVSKKEAKLRKRSLKPTATGSLETAMRPGSGPDPCVTTPPPRPAGGSPPGLATAGAGAAMPGSAAYVSRPRSELWATGVMASASLRGRGS